MKRVVVITGEASGDLYGGRLARAIKELLPEVELEGMGGSNMFEAGVNLRFDMANLSAIGAIEIINTIPRFFCRLKEVSNYLKTTAPDLLILIDFPEFNMRLAKVAKRLCIPTIYYIPPTAWAWRRGRAKIIAKSIDKVISIFDFETKVYLEAGNNVEFVGHPLLDIAIAKMTKEEACKIFNLDPTKKIIGILPGSRKKEIKVLLPIMLSAVEKIRLSMPDAQFVLPLASTLSLKDISDFGFLLRKILRMRISDFAIVENYTYEVMNISDLLIVASGTATLEAACFQTPMIIVYKLNWLTWQLGKLLVHTGGFIGLPNIVLGKQIVPELLQGKANPQDISQCALDLLKDEKKKQQMIKELRQVREKLGSPGASHRAAEAVVKWLK